MRKLTTEEFIERAILIHGNKYDYSKVNYKSAHEKVCIICPEHGEFWQRPNDHTKNELGCPLCNIKNKTSTLDSFVKRANLVHLNKYDYSKSIYTTAKLRIEIICPIHGSFWQKPNDHLRGQGCPKCKGIKLREHFALTDLEFIEKARKIHEINTIIVK